MNATPTESKVNLALVSLKPQNNFCVVLIALYPNLCMFFRSSSLTLERQNSYLHIILLSHKWMGKMHVVTLSGKVIIVSIGNSAHIDVCFSTLVSTIW